MQQQNVKLEPAPVEDDLVDLSSTYSYICSFCEKTTAVNPAFKHIYERLSGNKYYCCFCLSNRLNTRNNRNTLIMSYRGIIGYYYQHLYLTKKKVYLAEIEDMITAHQHVGLMNPVFKYDPETFLWFIDFSRVGRGPKKVPLKDVLKTIIVTMSCFNLITLNDKLQIEKLYEKYDEAIKKFHITRYRPLDKRMLIPTLTGCGLFDTFNFETTRSFIQNDLVMKTFS